MRWLRFVWLSALLAPAAFGQTPRALFDEGAALYGRGAYAQAAERFDASFALRPVPITKFNAARAWEQAGQTLKAIDAWQAWLRLSPGAPERPEAERSLAALGQKLAGLGLQALTVTSLPSGAAVTIDGASAGVTPLTVELPPTKHLLRLELAGRESVERAVLVQLARPMAEAFELPEASMTPGRPTALPAPTPLSAPVPLPAPSMPSPTSPTPLLDTVVVHILPADKTLRLKRAAGNPNGECRAPCDAPIRRASDTFWVEREASGRSPNFILADHAQAGQVTLRVGTSSRAPAVVMTVLGAAGVAGGTAGLFGGSPSDSAGLMALSITGVAVGSAVLLGSLYFWLAPGLTVDFAAD